MAVEYAVVSLERAVLDLREARYADVRALSRELVWVFNAEGMRPEALTALALFRKAVAEEKATADLARCLVRYFYRAQYDPELRFEG